MCVFLNLIPQFKLQDKAQHVSYKHAVFGNLELYIFQTCL